MTIWSMRADTDARQSSKNLVRTAIPSIIACARSGEVSGNCDRSISPSTSLVKNSRPTARTSGAAYGSSISGSGSTVAAARAAATIVAVAPTLEARSHESSEVRAMAQASSADR
ncbi:hypothetical protein FHR72_001355 [Mycolicibacterium iranicum]|uniref:Uncharacterized protein n=1 Tax=Mycolicibacterium iranicum TaxID=912594 RepID=A0A839Q9J8_MYCIR|nr:hypothetical protein [Mycolicibacterium iranicum]